MLFIFFSAVSKLVDLPAFRVGVAAWGILPAGFDSLAAFLVPLAELAVAGVWFLRVSRRAALFGALLMIGGYTSTYMAVWALRGAPECHCLGALERFEHLRALSQRLLLRNAVLLGLGFVGFVGLACSPKRGAEPARSISVTRPEVSDASAPGFTLVETLASITVVVLLLALVVAALPWSRGRAWRTVSLSNLRSHAAIFTMYETDFRGFFPYYTRPDQEESLISVPGTDQCVSVRYFWGAGRWNYVLANQYYGGEKDHESFYPPDYPDGHEAPALQLGATPYLFNCTFLADPDYWDPRTRVGPAQWRAVRADAVALTAKKALLVNEWFPPLRIGQGKRNSTELSLVDGSAATVLSGRIEPGYPNGDGPEMEPVHQGDYPPGQHTLQGVKGRDLR